MDSPVFVKRGVAVRKGKLARTIVVVRSIVEPIWAGTIFADHFYEQKYRWLLRVYRSD